MYIFLPIIGVVVLSVLAWFKPQVRRDMFLGALISLPFLLIQPLLHGRFSVHIHLTRSQGITFGEHAFFLFVAGALAGAVYKLFLHRHLTPVVHPRRGLMRWLFIGPLVTLALSLATHQSLFLCTLAGLGAELITILILRWVLVWDMLAAMAGAGMLYGVFYFVLNQIFQVPIADSGVLIAGRPLEDLLLVLTFGALWGPLYAAFRAVNKEKSEEFTVQHHVRKQMLIVGISLACAIGFYWLNVQFMRVPTVIAATPAAHTTLQSLVSPIIIQLDRPLDRSAVEVTVTPSVAGDVSFEDSYVEPSFVRRIVFTPQTYFQPETTYTVAISDLKNILGTKESSYSYTFQTPSLPVVSQMTPADNQAAVAICDPFTVVLTQPATKLSDISFELTPSVDFTAQLGSDKKTYTLKPTECLAQSQSYTLRAMRRLQVQATDGTSVSTGDPVQIGDTTFTTKGAPGISAMQPQGGGILASTKSATVNFTEPMDQVDLGSYASITPPVAGSWSWSDAQTATYTFSDALPLNTTVTVGLKQGLKDQKGGFIPSDASFSFTTIGHVRISSVSPYPGSGGVKITTPIHIAFDQPVDQASAQANFTLSPAADGSFSWSGQTMIFQANLASDTTYHITEASGVQSTIGLALANTYTSNFQTQESELLLNIPVYYQQHALSCEVASLKMALGYKGVSVSENDLLAALPTDTDPRNGTIWSNPNTVFVGDVNGHQDTTGYGVYAGPIVSLANQYRSAKTTSGWSVQDLAHALAAGDPIVFWGVAGNAKSDPWTTSDGQQINAWIGEHVRTLVGFTGSADNPTSFIINDPIFGRLRWTTAQFRSNWGTLGNMGVVIY